MIDGAAFPHDVAPAMRGEDLASMRASVARRAIAMTYDVTSRERASMHNANRLKIGLFAANLSSGRAVTRVAERWSGSWADNLKLARMADAAGIDFMLPLARW